jgi:hypothetical protein
VRTLKTLGCAKTMAAVVSVPPRVVNGRQQPDTGKVGSESNTRSAGCFNSPKVETNYPQAAHATGSSSCTAFG